jgi:hypothetical protein
MGQIDVHLALLELQFHTLDSPSSRDAQKYVRTVRNLA